VTTGALPGVRAWLVTSLLIVSYQSQIAPDQFDGALFRIRACREQFFRIRLTDPALIRRADRLAGTSHQPIISGELVRGSGAFNLPWSWHLVPETISFVDVTTEVCDGCPAQLEDSPDYWLTSEGRFCPWTARIESRLR
jgi:hypothetical protein